MRVIANNKEYKVKWRYDDKAILSSAECSIVETVTHDALIARLPIPEKRRNNINSVRLYVMKNALDKMFPRPLPTNEIKNRKGQIIYLDFTDDEQQQLEEHKEVRRAFYKAYFDRCPKVNKKKLKKALKNILTTEQIEEVLSKYVSEPVSTSKLVKDEA